MRSSSSSSASGEHRSGQVRPRGVRIDGGVRPLQETPPPFRVLEAVPSEGSAHLSPRKGACDSARTSGQSNTHSTESREIRYPWHPWCGRSVWIHRKVVKGGRAVYRCSLEPNHEARLFEVPQWMFESGACCQVRSAEKPAVNCAALLDLKLLLHHARSTARNLVLQAQHSSSPGGGADAKIGKATEGYPTGIVLPTTSDSKLAKVTARNQTEDSGTTGATAARTSQENPGLPARKGERR